METAIYLKAMGGLLCILGILAVFTCALKWLKIKGYGSSFMASSQIKIVESLKINPNRSVVVIEYKNFTHLILLGPPDLLIYSAPCEKASS